MGDILVLGNAGLDLRIELPRLPRAGESLLGGNPSRAPGGKGLNQAVAAARAGARARLFAPLGADATGDEVAAALRAEPFDGLELPRLAEPTDYSILMVLPDGENCVTGAGPCAAALDAGTAARFAAGAGPGDLLLVQGNLSAAATLAALQAAEGARRLFNPAPQWWDARPLLPHCTIVVANRGEAEALTGEASPEAGAAALHRAGVALAIVALGCIVADAGGLRHHPAVPTAAVDTTGCGDAFCGVLAAWLTRDAALDAAIAAAQRAAALTATRPGAYAALPTPAEMAAAPM
jgi:ribokinase